MAALSRVPKSGGSPPGLTPRCMRSPAEAGFTLLELLIVLGIMALAAGFAMPLATRPAGDATLTATARKLAADMRMARASAIRDNAERTLTLDLARRRFWVDGLTDASPIAGGIVIDVVTVRAEQRSPSQGRLRFFPDGSATGGTVMLTGGGRSVTVKLDWMTGHASVTRGR
jgi:general secretion pathway protein H